MAFPNFLSKLNWRLIIVHFIACWFFFHALKQLGYLYDYKFLELLIDSNFSELIKDNNSKGIQEAFKDYHGQEIGIRLSMDIIYTAYAALAGLLIGFVVSLLLSLKYKWYWVNSIIVLILGLIAFVIDRFYWHHVKFIFMFPGLPFKSNWAFNFTGGVFMLAIGLLLFFWKRLIKFIDGKKMNNIAPA